MYVTGGRALDGLGGLTALPNLTKLRIPVNLCGRHTVGANVHREKGNNPDQQLRPPIRGSVGKDVGIPKQPGGWLRSSHPLKKA
jgi:hypothetical protein